MKNRLPLVTGAAYLGLLLFSAGYCWGSQWHSPAESVESIAARPVLFPGATDASGAAGETLNLRAREVERQEDSEYGKPVLTGVLANTTREPLRYVEVQAEFTDASGTVVATGRDARGEMEPGETWRFEVLWPDTDEAREATGRIVKVIGRYN